MSTTGEPAGRPRPSWQGSGRTPGRRPTAAPRWRRGGEPTARPRARRSRAAAVVLAASALCAGLGALVWVASWFQPPRPSAVILAGAGYQDDLSVPHNAYGMNALRALAPDPDPAAGAAPGPLVLTDGAQLLDRIDAEGARTSLVYLALHGAADADGPFLLLGRPRPDADHERLPVRSLLEHLRGLAPRRFVLALDATQAPALPYLGVFRNDFAKALEELAAEGLPPNVVVLSASGVGQRSWTSNRWRTSVFGHFLAEALAAPPPAAGAGAGAAGRGVNVERLWREVRAEVERWSVDHRGELQSPVLLPDPAVSDRARSLELAARPGGGRPPAAADPSPVPGRWHDDWVKAWQGHAALEAAGPAPAVVSPVLWRRYRDRLLRFDQLVRADDPAAAAARAAVDVLRERLLAEREVTLSSARNSLAMPAVGGAAPPDPSADRADLNALWSGASTVEQALGGDPGRRWRFTGLLFQRAAGDPSAGVLATAVRLLGEVADPVAPRPAEVTLLEAVARAGPPRPVDPVAYRGLVAEALSVRARGERAAVAARADGPSYAEYVAPWVAPLVREGDALRRRGEDLAFADDRAGWAEARRALDGAEALYRQAEARADEVRGAREVCDRALADLPYYADWAAGLRDADPGRGTVRLVRDLLAAAHALAGSLAAEPPDPAGLGAIRERAATLRDGLAALRGAFDRSCDPGGRDYRALAAAAETPLPPPGAREALLRGLAGFSAESPPGPTPPAPGRETASERADRAAGVRRALAEAVMGADWSGGTGDFTGPLPGDGGPAAAGAPARADLVVERWRSMPSAIGDWVRDTRGAEPGALPRDLRRADLLARRLPAAVEAPVGGWAAGDRPGAAEAPRAWRLRLLQRLLIGQARRALEDHWFQADGRPYYSEVGGRFLADVRALQRALGGGAEDGAGLAALRASLARADRLEVTGPGALDLTTERVVGLDFGLRAPPGSAVPGGTPVVWVEADPAGRLVAEDGSSGRRRPEVRAAAPAGGDRRPPPTLLRMRFRLPLADEVEADPARFTRPGPVRSTVTLHGVYRGQGLRLEVPVRSHPVPEVTAVRYPLPLTGRVAVAADHALVARHGEGQGALAIVLDGSGSMSAVTAKGADGAASATKYTEAIAALRRALGRVSRGTVVSLWVFGEAVPPGNDAEAERTIRRVLPPTRWDPSDARLIDDVMRRVEPPAVRPWNDSPVVRTMLLARGDLERSGAAARSLLVLTDGLDNRFADDAELNPEKKDIPTALRDAFVKTDVRVLVVGYRQSDADAAAAREQFRVLEGLPRPGQFFTVREPGRLAAALASILRPTLRASVETLGNEPLAALSVGRAGAPAGWSEPALPPGGYKLVARAGVRVERELVVNRGDLLLVRLAERPGGGLGLEREFPAGPDGPAGRGPANGWRFSVVRDARVGPALDGLEVWATLEKAPGPRESALEMVRPRAFWMEVAPAGAGGAVAAPYAQRWGYQAGLAAPCWVARSAAWPSAEGDATPATAPPRVRAWWDPDQEPPYTTAVVRRADYASTDEAPARPVEVDGNVVAVEGVTVEEHRVEVARGEWGVRSCLVVRLRFDGGSGGPFQVRPLGLRPEGAEHRFFHAARRYTGLFWPVTPDQAAVALDGLGLVSVRGLKERAERRGYTAEWQAPGAPDPTAAAPDLVPFDDPDPGPDPLPDGGHWTR